MSRINRKNWNADDFGDKNTKGLFGIIDVAMKENFRITDNEYDNFCGNASDEELDLFLSENYSFTEKRKIIEILNKYIKYE